MLMGYGIGADLRGACPQLGVNTFQERPSGACGMQENLLAAGAPPWTPLRELAALPNNPTLPLSAL